MWTWFSCRWPKRVCCSSVLRLTSQPTMTASWSKAINMYYIVLWICRWQFIIRLWGRACMCACSNRNCCEIWGVLELLDCLLWSVWPSQPWLQRGILQELHACHECLGQSRYSIVFIFMRPLFPNPEPIFTIWNLIALKYLTHLLSDIISLYDVL